MLYRQCQYITVQGGPYGTHNLPLGEERRGPQCCMSIGYRQAGIDRDLKSLCFTNGNNGRDLFGLKRIYVAAD